MINIFIQIYVYSIIAMCIFRFFSKYIFSNDEIVLKLLEMYDYDINNFENDWIILTITPILNTFMSIIYTLLAIIFLFEYLFLNKK